MSWADPTQPSAEVECCWPRSAQTTVCFPQGKTIESQSASRSPSMDLMYSPAWVDDTNIIYMLCDSRHHCSYWFGQEIARGDPLRCSSGNRSVHPWSSSVQINYRRSRNPSDVQCRWPKTGANAHRAQHNKRLTKRMKIKWKPTTRVLARPNLWTS